MTIREKIVKLAIHIAKLPLELTEESPNYYMLECVVSDEMADMALKMEVDRRFTVEEVAELCGRTIEETQKLLDAMTYIGVIYFNKIDGRLVYWVENLIPGVIEGMVMNKELSDKYPQIGRAWDEMAMEGHGNGLAQYVPIGMAPMRVIPIESALPSDQRTATFEEISFWLDKYRDQLAVGDCACRMSRRLAGDGCGHLEKDMCMLVGDTADYCTMTNRARRINYDEALEILKSAEENGLVHQVTNIHGDDKIMAICNCCTCGCYALRSSLYHNAPNISRSNFVAEVNAEECVACGQCVEVCPANAVKLGQSLCGKTPIEIPVSLLPDDNEWGPEQYNPGYRDNRVSTLETGTAPCKTACPAHIGVQGYIKLASEGRYMDALELIKKDNPLPAVCGRICPHACESECTRGIIDEPVAIDEIKKFIADKELNADTRFIPRKMHDYGKRMAVIGSGPSGLACAYYLAIDGYRVTVFEKEEKLGGMLTLGIPSFRLEKDVVNAEIDILREMGVEFKTGIEVGKDVTITYLRDRGYDAFYVAIGAQKGKKPGVEGEDAEGVISGVEFLRRINLGKSVETKGKVVVIGGGNVAIDVARSATRTGSDSVAMYCLESREEMPSLDEEITEAVEEGVSINNSWAVKRIVVENGKVKGVEFRKCVSVFDEDNKFAPKYDENKVITVEADYVLFSIGQSIDWGNLLNGSKIKLNSDGTAVADELTLQTGQDDVFVGGDVYTGPSFAINAIVAGKQAAISMHRKVWPGQSLSAGRDRRVYKTLDKNNIVVEGYDSAPRQKVENTNESRKSFKDTRITFTEEQLKKETARCLGCGVAVVDQNYCLGCALCVSKCKVNAVKLVKKFDANGVLLEDFIPVMMKYGAERQVKLDKKIEEAMVKKGRQN